MKLAIMQPYFFPYIGYWQLINAVDKFIIYDDVNYIKGGWINRNRILMNGESNVINLQICQASQNKLINETEIYDNPKHNQKLFKKLEKCYIKAPYYLDSLPLIKNVILQDEKKLSLNLERSIREICRYLNIETEIMVSSAINKNNELRGQYKIIQICEIINANNYISAIGGQSLYSKEFFAENELKLLFIKPGDIRYKQFKNEFVPNLSIIDVLMFNSIEAIKKMLSDYELI